MMLEDHFAEPIHGTKEEREKVTAATVAQLEKEFQSGVSDRRRTLARLRKREKAE